VMIVMMLLMRTDGTGAAAPRCYGTLLIPTVLIVLLVLTVLAVLAPL
jgi:hypothetical protein